jgi:hypothetical protein
MLMAEFQALLNEAQKEIFQINLSDLKRMLESREDFCLIDVRDQQDADKGMIPASGERQSRHAGARHRPGHHPEESEDHALLWRGQPFRLRQPYP